MSAIAGRNGRLYANVASGGTAEPIPFLASFDLDAQSDQYDVTSFGDSFKQTVAGLPSGSGAFSGYYDNATAQFYTAALDGVARKFYFYPSVQGSPGNSQYFFGTANFSMSLKFPVDGPATITGSWAAATVIAKVG